MQEMQKILLSNQATHLIKSYFETAEDLGETVEEAYALLASKLHNVLTEKSSLFRSSHTKSFLEIKNKSTARGEARDYVKQLKLKGVVNKLAVIKKLEESGFSRRKAYQTWYREYKRKRR